MSDFLVPYEVFSDAAAYNVYAVALDRKLSTLSGGLDVLPWPEVDFAKFGPVELKPRSRIKKLSAANLHRNWVMIPHVTNHDDADITELEAFRVQLNKENEKSGVRVGIDITSLLVTSGGVGRYLRNAIAGLLRAGPDVARLDQYSPPARRTPSGLTARELEVLGERDQVHEDRLRRDLVALEVVAVAVEVRGRNRREVERRAVRVHGRRRSRQRCGRIAERRRD